MAASLLDVSQDGARVVLKEVVELQKEVEISFTSMAAHRTIKGVGNVVWVVPLEDGKCIAGVNFQKRIAWSDVMSLSRP